MRRVCTVGSHRSPFNQTEAGPGYRFPAPSTNQHPKVDFVVGETVTRTKEDLFVKKWGKFNRERQRMAQVCGVVISFRKLRKRTRLEATGRGLQVLLVNSPSKNDIVVNSMFIKSIVETVKIESLTGLKHISFKGSWISLLETVKVWNWYQMGWKKPMIFVGFFWWHPCARQVHEIWWNKSPLTLRNFLVDSPECWLLWLDLLSTCSVLRWFLILCHGKVTIKPALKGDGCFRKWWYPQIIHFNRVFHYKPSILGYPYFWKHPDVFFVGSFFQASSTVANHSCWCSQETKILGGGNSNIFF